MNKLALLGALCAPVFTSFAAQDPQPASLQQVTATVLCEGADGTSDSGPGTTNPEGPGSASTYCQATLNSFGTAASIGYAGSLALVDNTFALTVSGAAAIPTSWGMFTYGGVQTNIPFGNGYLCISPFNPGIFKMPTQQLGTGTVILEMATHPAEFANFTPASSWNFQFWYRDPPAGGAYFNLSNGLHVNFAP